MPNPSLTLQLGGGTLPPGPVIPTGSGALPEDFAFIILLFVLFVIPKALQRYRIPAAITSLILGAIASNTGLIDGSLTLQLLSTFGIVSLFLFAGLEIQAEDLRRGARTLVEHVVLWSILVLATAWSAYAILGLGWRPAALIAIALMTPSTGFILSSLASFGLRPDEQFAVKSKAVFSANVAPYAPRSEFAFLLMVAVLCAWATRRLGVYYLVGAFIVGVAAQRFRERLPAMSSEKMIDALEAFGSVFIPFYFFHAGTHIRGEQLSLSAIGIGLLLLIVCVPLRIAVTALHRKVGLRETISDARRIGMALVPTLVFTLVLVQILRERFAVDEALLGGLVLYTVLNTMLPSLLLHAGTPAFEDPHAEEVLPQA